MRLVQTATNMYGAVIVACPPSTTPGYHILTQRLDAMILVAPIGHPLPNEIESAIHTLDDRRATALGVVLLTRAENPISTAFGRLRNTIAESSSEPSTQPETGHEANVSPQPTDGAPESTRQGSTETGPQGRGPSRQITDRVTIVSVEGPLPDGAQPGNPKIEIDDVAPADGAKAAGSTTRSRKTTTKSAASAKPSTDAAATGKDAARDRRFRLIFRSERDRQGVHNKGAESEDQGQDAGRFDRRQGVCCVDLG